MTIYEVLQIMIGSLLGATSGYYLAQAVCNKLHPQKPATNIYWTMTDEQAEKIGDTLTEAIREYGETNKESEND